MGKRMEETMKLYDSGVYLVNGNELVPDGVNAIEEVVKKTGAAVTKEQAAENTIAYGILKIIIHPAIWTNFRSSLTS